LIEEVLKEAEVELFEINDIILAGGSMKIPLFQQHIQELFKD